MYGTLGTTVNAAIVDYMNEHKTPQVYIASGALWTGDIAKHPWTLPWHLPYVAEGGIYGRYIASTNPKAKVVVLKQGDSFGDEYFEGFKKALDEKGIKIAEVETYDPGTPSVDSQVIKLASTKADVLFLAAAPKYTTQAIAKKGRVGLECDDLCQCRVLIDWFCAQACGPVEFQGCHHRRRGEGPIGFPLGQ
ncbi:hypothetical protein CDEF62S_00988 [Castellaniella defragrans]